MRAPARGTGFSLIEVLIAVLIMTVGILAIVTTLWWGFKAGEQGTRMTEATNCARVLMETIVGNNMVNSSQPMSGGWLAPGSGLYDPDVPFNQRPLVEAKLYAVGNGSGIEPFGDPTSPENPVSSKYRSQTVAYRLDDYRRQIVAEPVANAGSYTFQQNLAKVTVKVFWMQRGVERSVELIGVVPSTIP